MAFLIAPAPGVSAPASVTLTATAGSDTTIDLSWSGGSGVTTWNVYRGTSTGFTVGAGSLIEEDLASGTTTYEDTGLTAETEYFYVVRAVNSGGFTDSNEDSATTEAASGSLFTPLFESQWTTGVGDTDAIVLDSSNDGWDRFWSPSDFLLDVLAPGSVPGAASPFSGNVLRTEDTSVASHPGQEPGANAFARNIEKDFSPTLGEDLYIVYGYRIDSDGVSSVSHHECPVISYRNCCPHTPETTSGNYRPVLRQEGGTGSNLPYATGAGALPYPFYRWVVPAASQLSRGVWYRHEFRIEIVGRQGVEASRVGTNWSSAWGETGQVEFRIHPRIFLGDTSTLLIDASDYLSLDYPFDGGQTLAEFYASGRTFCTSNTLIGGAGGSALDNLYKFGLGNNGANAGSGGPGDYWYYAHFRAGTGGWPTEI